MRRVLWHTKHREPCIWGYFLRQKFFLFLLSVPCRLPGRNLTGQGEDTAGFKCYPVLRRPDANNSGMQQRFHEKIPFKI
jgi:hypothetical protein